MARFTVPSESPPSTPGTGSSASPRTPPNDTLGPNSFRVPSATPSADGDADADDERSPTTPPIYTNGPNTFRVPSSHGTPSTTSARGSRSPSGSPPPTSTSQMPGAYCDAETPRRAALNSLSFSQMGTQPQNPRLNDFFSRRARNTSSPSPPDTNRKRRSKSPSPETPAAQRPRHNFRPAVPLMRRNADGSIRRDTTPVSRGVPYKVPSVPSSSSSSSSSSSDDSDGSNDGGNGDPDGDDDFGPSDHSSDNTDLNFSDEELPPPKDYNPPRRPGRLGASQPAPSKSLTLLKERPGRLPSHTARSPTSPGFEWGDGAAWWHPAGSNGTEGIVREIFMADFRKDIDHDQAQATAELCYHESLINMLDGDGFHPHQADVRPEVLYEFCRGGTLNRLLLSRKPEAPALKPRRVATYLPTRKVVLGLPEDLVWHVLLSLLRATYWLHSRRQPVVHCAIDPANVFFTAPRPDDERALVRRYGLVKLGNFSKAVILPHRMDPDINNDEEIQGRCKMFEHMITEAYQETGYEAPELLGMLGEDEVIDEKIFPGPCSDIFSIGATCFAMMTGKTLWDVLLERRFISRSLGPARRDRAILEEKWRFAEFEERMDLLRPILQGEQVIGSALPKLYSADLRDFVAGLLNLDPDMRGESAGVLDEAEEAFADKSSDESLRAMQRRWRRAMREMVGSKEKAMRSHEELMGLESVQAMRRSEARGPLVP